MTAGTLDSASAQFLEAMRAGGGKPLHQLTVAEVRETVRGASLQLAPPRLELHRVDDRRLPVEGGTIGIRIYTPRPPAAGERLPLVLHYHGGGFVAGDLDTHDSICRHYAVHADAIVVGVDYRLAPEHPFPAAVDDAYAAFLWAVTHAEELQGDANRVAVTGDSAGGALATVVCLLAKERGGPRIAYQALVYPSVDWDLTRPSASRTQFGDGSFFLSTEDIAWFRRQYVGDRPAVIGDPRASPLAAPDLAGLPPALVVTAGCDPLRDEGKAYADRLAASGVPVEYHCVEGTIHACMSFAAAIPAGLTILSLVASRLRSGLRVVGG